MTWRDQAACAGMGPARFYPPGADGHTGGDTAAVYAHARRICARCPVTAECAAAGLHELHGMWGAQTPRERQRARRDTIIPAADCCGTNRGYQRHLYRREPTCPACREARAAYMRTLRARRRNAKKRAS